jgi:rsbT co-antagonist protein RsbR
MAEAVIPGLIEKHHQDLLSEWLANQKRAGGLRNGQISEAELGEQSRRFLAELRHGVTGRLDDISGPEWDLTRGLLDTIAGERAVQGFSSAETASFVFSLKEPLFALLRQEIGGNSTALARETWAASMLIDKLGLYTFEVHQKGREDVIRRQQEELMELSTPVIQLWDGVLALPLIGTLDSARTQTVMESLLERIVTSGAEVAIIDITGVPTVDTLVAQHLIKTVSAARLMGADCIISGIRPQIAQTIVHLGLELDVVSKATMADAFALALRRLDKMVVNRAQPKPGGE